MTPPLTFDSGLRALCGIAAYYWIAAEPSLLQREFALGTRTAEIPDLLRAAKRLGLFRGHSWFRQSCMLYELIPNMPEQRLRPLVQGFSEYIIQNGAITQTFSSF